VLSDVEHRLTGQPEIEFYYPRVVAFTGGAIVVAVGVVSNGAQSGPSTAQCFGYAIAVRPLAIQGRISRIELKRRYGASCEYAE